MSNHATSPYMLIFRETSPNIYGGMSPDQRQQLMQQWNTWVDGLAARGKLKMGHPLENGGRVITGAGGSRVVDGPFAEAKEAIGGFIMVLADDLDEATEMGRGCPSLAHGMAVEVRQLAQACEELGVQHRPAQEMAQV